MYDVQRLCRHVEAPSLVTPTGTEVCSVHVRLLEWLVIPTQVWVPAQCCKAQVASAFAGEQVTITQHGRRCGAV